MIKSFEIIDDPWICKNYVKFTIDSYKIIKLDVDYLDLTEVKDIKKQLIKLELMYKIYTRAVNNQLYTNEECQQIKNIIFNSPVDLNGVKFMEYTIEDPDIDYLLNSIKLVDIKTYGDAFKMFGHPDHDYKYLDGYYLYIKELDINDTSHLNMSNITYTGPSTFMHTTKRATERLLKIYIDLFDTINIKYVKFSILFEYTKLHPYLINNICKYNQYYLKCYY